ncbi:recombinase RecT [Vibrio vulnificus]|nr:recombinase RecT [Vibrio vulnificus]
MISRWKDPAYLNCVMAFATIMAKSKIINYVFRGDVETCALIAMQADAWGVDPMFAAQNSFIDEYQRLMQNGKLMRQIIENLAEVKSITTEYSGSWDKVENRFRMEGDRAVHLWSASDEQGLEFRISINMKGDKPAIVRSYALSDIDTTYRQLNSAWARSPKNQILNMAIREIGNHELSTLVNGYDATNAEDESQAALLLKSNAKTQTSNEPDFQVNDSEQIVSVNNQDSTYRDAHQLTDELERLATGSDDVQDQLKLGLKSLVATIQENVAYWDEQQIAIMKQRYSLLLSKAQQQQAQ